jgi:hypothetical protein
VLVISVWKWLSVGNLAGEVVGVGNLGGEVLSVGNLAGKW